MKIHFFILFFVFASVICENQVKISYSKIGEKWREITSYIHAVFTMGGLKDFISYLINTVISFFSK